MPLTPFHWGPGLLFGLLLLSYLDLPTLLLSSTIVDVEPLLVLTMNLQYPVHGYLHTFFGGTILAFLLALIVSRVGGALEPLMSFLKLPQKTSFRRIVSASLFGIYLHILLDSTLYPDIRPFYPFELNPLLGQGMFLGFGIYMLCVLSFIGAVVIYTARVVFLRRTR